MISDTLEASAGAQEACQLLCRWSPDELDHGLLGLTQDEPGLDISLLGAACQGDRQALTKLWPTIQRLVCSRSALQHVIAQHAAQSGFVHLLQCIRQQSAPDFAKYAPDVAATAIRSGHRGYAVLSWLASEPNLGYVWQPSTCTAAAELGNLELLQWLQQPQWSCPWDQTHCARLLTSSQAWADLRYCSEQDIGSKYISPGLCTLAAEMGDSATLIKLRTASRPCPYSLETCVALAERGDDQLLLWLLDGEVARTIQNRSPREEIHSSLADFAVSDGNLKLLAWLKAHSPPSILPAATSKHELWRPRAFCACSPMPAHAMPLTLPELPLMAIWLK